jgi:cytochrome P450
MESISLHPQMLIPVESSGSSNSMIMESANHAMQPLLHWLVLSILLAFVVYRCIRYFISELPPFGSGLKRLPGPMSTLPYLGRIHDVDRMQPWTAMKKFSDKYDGLFACTLGGETHIWVARDDVAEDLLCNNAAISSARADLGVYPDVTKGFRYLPLLGYTEVFHRQRKFAHMVMTRSVNNKFYGHIDRQTKRLMHELTIEPNNWFNLLHLFCARVSSQLAYGSDDSAQDHLDNANMFLNQIGPSGPAPNLAPFLIVFPEWLVPGKRAVRLRQQAEDLLWDRVFDETRERTFQEGLPSTFVGASFQAKALGEDKRLLFENEAEARCAVGMLCTTAIVTIAGPATLFVMAMILHPKWQIKIRDQIDEVVRDGMVDLRHSPQLPILRAGIRECVRWRSTVPLGNSSCRQFHVSRS